MDTFSRQLRSFVEGLSSIGSRDFQPFQVAYKTYALGWVSGGSDLMEDLPRYRWCLALISCFPHILRKGGMCTFTISKGARVSIETLLERIPC